MTDKRQFDEIWNHWEKFKRIHLGDIVIWNQILNVCLVTGDVIKGIELFNEMQQHGIKYDDVALRTLLILAINNNAIDTAIFLIQHVLNKDDKTILTLTFWTLINKYFNRTNKLHLLKLNTGHFISICMCITTHGLAGDLQNLMHQYNVNMEGSRASKRKLFYLVSECVGFLLHDEKELNSWKNIMTECGFPFEFPPPDLNLVS